MVDDYGKNISNTASRLQYYWQAYDQTRSTDQSIVRIIYRLLNLNDQDRYLDIDCGSGNYTVALSNKKFRSYALTA